MIIEKFTVTPFQQNTRIVVCAETREAICIDPGEKSAALFDFLAKTECELRAIALTHAHLDHIGGTSALHEKFPEAEIILHKDDETLYDNLPAQPLAMGIPPAQLEALGMNYENPPPLSRHWQHEEIFPVGNLRFNIRHTPGHSPGHVILIEENHRKIFSGDCIFENSIGRTDLPGGSFEQLIESIERDILALAEDFEIHPGHGAETTVGRERRLNPFLNGAYQTNAGRFG